MLLAVVLRVSAITRTLAGAFVGLTVCSIVRFIPVWTDEFEGLASVALCSVQYGTV